MILDKMKLTVLTCYICLAVTSCAPDDIRAALDEAKAASSATSALSIIRKASAKNCRPVPHSCLPPTELINAESEYFALAARSGDSKILRELFTRPGGNALQKELTAKVLNEAKQSNDPNLLFAAGSILYEGSVEPRDTKAALQFFERAWVVGDKDVAGIISRIHQRAGNLEAAYLWSLRCVGSCDRHADTRIGEFVGAIDLLELEKKLSAATIEKIQQAAKRK